MVYFNRYMYLAKKFFGVFSLDLAIFLAMFGGFEEKKAGNPAFATEITAQETVAQRALQCGHL